jgi:multicomponent Na+:H+ antiporter subunit C
MIVANYVAAVGTFSLGLFTLMSRRDLVRIVMGLSLMESSVYLLLISMAYRRHGTAPVLLQPPPGSSVKAITAGHASDPVLQNFCLTAIVIGVSVTAVCLTVAVRTSQHYRSGDADDIRELHG